MPEGQADVRRADALSGLLGNAVEAADGQGKDVAGNSGGVGFLHMELQSLCQCPSSFGAVSDWPRGLHQGSFQKLGRRTPQHDSSWNFAALLAQ